MGYYIYVRTTEKHACIVKHASAIEDFLTLLFRGRLIAHLNDDNYKLARKHKNYP